MTDPVQADVWAVTLVYERSVTIYVKDTSRANAIETAKEAAPDVEVGDDPGSDYDRWTIANMADDPVSLNSLDDEQWVWMPGARRAVCEMACDLKDEEQERP